MPFIAPDNHARVLWSSFITKQARRAVNDGGICLRFLDVDFGLSRRLIEIYLLDNHLQLTD